jgi:phage terminase large subunit GpA-like protein
MMARVGKPTFATYPCYPDWYDPKQPEGSGCSKRFHWSCAICGFQTAVTWAKHTQVVYPDKTEANSGVFRYHCRQCGVMVDGSYNGKGNSRRQEDAVQKALQALKKPHHEELSVAITLLLERNLLGAATALQHVKTRRAKKTRAVGIEEEM